MQWRWLVGLATVCAWVFAAQALSAATTPEAAARVAEAHSGDSRPSIRVFATGLETNGCDVVEVVETDDDTSETGTPPLASLQRAISARSAVAWVTERRASDRWRDPNGVRGPPRG
jgi:hypothetical protein